MVQFLPFNIKDEDSMGDVLSHIDNAIQFGESQELKEKKVSILMCLLVMCWCRSSILRTSPGNNNNTLTIN